MMNRSVFMICALAAIAVTGCNGGDENARHYTNKVFISGGSYVNNVRVEDETKTMVRNVSIEMAKKEAKDVSAFFSVAPELLDVYRKAYYDESVQLLPEAHYDFSSFEETIKAGSVLSDPETLEFIDLDQLDLSGKYVLPLTITSSSIEVLQSAKTLYYVFKGASLINIVADISENKAWPEWGEFTEVHDMTAFSMEALIMGNAFKNQLSTIMGIEDKFLIRAGDVTIPTNQLQIACAVTVEVPLEDGSGTETITERINLTDPSLQLETGRWYHIAVTFDNGSIKVYLDGRERVSGSTGDLGVGSIDFQVPHSDESEGKPRCFWVGYSYDNLRWFDGMISEARVWNKALTSEEINSLNHFYFVEPNSEGLVAYWKFNDGAGNTIKDYSPYANNLTAEKNPKWIEVELPVR